MKLKEFLARWFAPPESKEEVIRRYRRIAVREALLGLAMLLIYFSVPVWAPESHADTFSVVFLAAAGILATLAASTLWTAASLKRDRYY
jgi:hypothetical protein